MCSTSAIGDVTPDGAWRRCLRISLLTVRIWRERHRARKQLASVDARSLRDLGIDPVLVDYELTQPCWRPLRDWRS